MAFIFVSLGGFKVLPARDWFLTFIYGCTMFVSMVGYMVGLKLSSPVMAAIWQPTQPIFALVLGVIMGTERPSLLKCVGILLAIGGCTYIVLARPKDKSTVSEDPPAVGSAIVNAIFVLACVGSASMVVVVKALLSRGHTFAPVVGWASAVCSILLALATYFAHSNEATLELLCPVENGGCGNGYVLPPGFLLPYIYVVVFMSVIPYFLNTVAAQALEGSVASAYTAAQPVVSAAATVLAKNFFPDADLNLPHHSMIWGVLGIFAGLGLVAYASSSSKEKHLKKD
eukprot:CAMPEP_0114522878 /NCGR_PEP_ID=MMETSP0109-20121206/20984_1 /TAXON_ID=29199 /ORGANISM="Chlorarachnion reptans, Strain CCCM449" /LENGTH=284 /DNA_ID=CAMNT_0001704139 /DNA_START=108 /DNA_END=962 /DNA_ORIENTATION=-